MDKLNEQLYLIYAKELLQLNIGYPINATKLRRMMDIIANINYIKQSSCSSKEVINIINSVYETI